MAHFTAVLADLQRTDAARPLITFYDHASGERTELSVATYANWVAKTASYLTEECDLERGARLRVDLPTHWLGPVFLGAAWAAGLTVVWDGAADAVVVGPDSLAGASGDVVVATALHPLGRAFELALPAGVRDFGAEVWSQPDAFVPWDPPTEDDPAYDDVTHATLWRAAAAGELLGGALDDGGRLFTEANPASPSGLACFAEPLARRGSMVLVRHLDPARADSTYDAERASARWTP